MLQCVEILIIFEHLVDRFWNTMIFPKDTMYPLNLDTYAVVIVVCI